MSLTDAVQALQDNLNQSIKALNSAATLDSNRSAKTDTGAVTTNLQTLTSSSATSSLAGNPILAAAGDTANQAITTIAQKVVQTAISKVNLTPIQNASQQFFTMFAQVATFGQEVAMELARNTGHNIVTAMAQKDAVSVQLETELTALGNACLILLNGSPFFNQYLQNVIKAYALIATGRQPTKKRGGNPQEHLSAVQYSYLQQRPQQPEHGQRSVATAEQRRHQQHPLDWKSYFLNPQTAVECSSHGRCPFDPRITLNVGKLILQYEVLTINVNAYINTYVNALSDYISGYPASASIYQATIDHLTAGTSQLDALLGQMGPILTNIAKNQTDTKSKVQLSSYGTLWGVSLTAIIAWLKLNPGAGAIQLDKTASSGQAYNKSVATITAIGNRAYPGGTVFITAGEEDPITGFVRPSAKFMATANLIVVSSTNTRASVSQQVNNLKHYLEAARGVDAQIVQALQPFLNTKSTIGGSVGKALGQLIGFANKAGLDRIAGLLTNGNVKDLLSSTPATTTYNGAAVVGINSILTALNSSPNATPNKSRRFRTFATR